MFSLDLRIYGHRCVRLQLAGLIAIVAVCVAFTSCRAATTQDGAFRKAMFQGNAVAAMRIARQQGMDPFWIALYRDQLRYQFPNLLDTATRCRNSLGARQNDPQAMRDAVTCNSFVLEASRELGDARGYFEALAWRRQHAAVNRKPGQQTESRFRLPYPKLDLARLADSVPAFSLVRDSATPVVLQYVKSNRDALESGGLGHRFAGTGMAMRQPVVPTVAITIDGHDVDAMVDTGQNSALVVSASESKSIGAETLVPGAHPFRLFGRPTDIPAHRIALALVRHLRLGPLQLNNVMAVVVPDGYAYGGKESVTIGLPVLARLDNVEFRQSSMVLDAAIEPCSRPMSATYARVMGRGGLLVFDGEADGRNIKVALDTGSDALLLAGRGLMPASYAAAATSDSDRTRGERAHDGYRYLAIHIAKLNLSDGAAPVFPDLAFPDVLIGAPALAEVDVRFNFTPELSLCFTRRLSPKADTPSPRPKTDMHLTGSVSEVHLLHMPPGTNSKGSRTTRTPSFEPVSAFRTPLLQGMNMYPGRTIANRYVPPPPPWLHFRFHCVIYHGNVYIDGSVTGNFGRPMPGETVYIGHGSSAVMALTSNGSGHFDGVAASAASPIATPANMTRTPMQCTSPQVKVGVPSRVK